MAKERLHFSRDEKAKMLREGTTLDAYEISVLVRMTEVFTFVMLKELAQVVGKFAKGRE